MSIKAGGVELRFSLSRRSLITLSTGSYSLRRLNVNGAVSIAKWPSFDKDLRVFGIMFGYG